jgi:4-amino-4-deoxy-L-arabinose transferase-like glycosyltransferase
MLLEHPKWFCCFTLAALALRLLFYFRFPHITGDTLIYGDIAKNWLDQGVFGLTHAEGVRPTWIRLPGYPAFLVLCFKLFGREHYHAVLLMQIVLDIACCFAIADLARRTLSSRAARWAFALAAICPFTANYTVAPLAETLSIFFTAVGSCPSATVLSITSCVLDSGALGEVVIGGLVRRDIARIFAPPSTPRAISPGRCASCRAARRR